MQSPAIAVAPLARGRLRPGALAVTVAVGAALAGCGGSRSAAGESSAVARLDVKLQPSPSLRRAAPDFVLRDSSGRPVRLSQFRGKAVILTFIYDHCPDVCPLIVGNLHTALVRLGPRARSLQIVAVSVDPRGDTPATVKAFLKAHEMTGRMEYLIGSQRELAPVWREYGIAVQSSPDSREVSHSGVLFGITGRGSAVVLYPPTFQPEWIAHDAPLLARE